MLLQKLTERPFAPKRNQPGYAPIGCYPPGPRAYGLPGAFSRHNQSRSVVFRQQIPAMSARRLVRGNNILRRSLPCERVVKFPRRRRRRSSGRFMKSQLQKSLNAKRSVVIGGHKTSVSLEDAFWKGFNEIAASRNMTLSDLLATIDSDRQHGNLSSAIRLFVLDHYRAQVDARRSAERPIDEKGRSAYRAAPHQ
jgi:predicted DNA-binding ribbon-helix-helix protein